MERFNRRVLRFISRVGRFRRRVIRVIRRMSRFTCRVVRVSRRVHRFTKFVQRFIKFVKRGIRRLKKTASNRVFGIKIGANGINRKVRNCSRERSAVK